VLEGASCTRKRRHAVLPPGEPHATCKLPGIRDFAASEGVEKTNGIAMR
jgi:hypothetical protein